MKKFGAVVFLAGTIVAATGTSPEELAPRARSLARDFQLSLQGELFSAIKAGGPVEALDVCRTKAPAIATDTAGKTGWRVGRTALKVRNPLNRPDAWEEAGLREFGARLARGEDGAKLERFDVVERDGAPVFRYMKAIVTAGPCLGCHGAKLEPAVAKKVQELYPEDAATGFAVGDLRGAFTLSKPL